MKLDLVESQLQKAQPEIKVDMEDERYSLQDTCYLISQHERKQQTGAFMTFYVSLGRGPPRIVLAFHNIPVYVY